MKPTGQEIELKLQFSNPRDFEATLREAGGVHQGTVLQRNHFFDDALRTLRAHAFGLRLREEDGRCFLTAKGKKNASAQVALSSRREEEIVVATPEAARILAGQLSPLASLQAHVRPAGRALLAEMESALQGRPLTYIGAFENQRTRVQTELLTPKGPLPVLLEFDRTVFPGDQVQFEIELELGPDEDAAAAEVGLRGLLSRAGAAGRPALGKAARFFAFLEIENARAKDQNLP